MKRITTLLLAVAFTLGSVCAAQADGIDIKVKGQWDFAFGMVGNGVFKHSANSSDSGRYARPGAGAKSRQRDEDNFEARQRIRTQINFIASEYLQGVLHFEIGDLDWGRPGTGRQQGAALDTDGVNIETKHAYIDWIIPNTPVSVRMGLQPLTLPSSRLGSIILNADMAAIAVSSPVTDWLSLTALWARPLDRFRDGNSRNLDDEVDLFGLVAPMKFTGVSFSPYFIWGKIGTGSGFLNNYAFQNHDLLRGTGWGNWAGLDAYNDNDAKIWYLGTNFKLDAFDPLVFNMDVIYGHLQTAEYAPLALNRGNHTHAGADGWYIGATLDYKMAWGTPGIFGWYASGDDADDFRDKGELGRLPAILNDGGTFKATSFGLHGHYGIGNGGNYNRISGTGTGLWGIGIQVADVSFVQDLKHTLRFAYYRGTNDSDMAQATLGLGANWYGDNIYLTKDDSVFEVNFDHQYKIYENLTAVLELGYLRLNSDTDTWQGRNYNGDLKDNDNAWKAEINFRYSF